MTTPAVLRKIARAAACACAAAACFWAAAAHAGSIRAVGVLGNSGRCGASLVRVPAYPDGQRVTGVAVAEDSTVWLSADGAVNRLALSGELLSRRPLAPAGSVVESTTFAVLDGVLYFLGRRPDKRPALFALPMRRGGGPARPVDVGLPARRYGHLPHVLAPQPLDGRLVLVNAPPRSRRLDVHLLDPARRTIRKAFSLDGGAPHGAAVDAERRIIYVGAESILAVGPDGRPASPNFPVACMKTPAIPTAFRGTISLAGGALWDTAWYGFLSRHGTDGRNAPGRVVEWHHELGFPRQIAGLARTHPSLDALLITTATPAALYYAHWDRARSRLRFVRRLGCLPDIVSLGLSADGWVTVGSARSQLWWRWDDAADAPPRAAKLHVAVTPPFFHGGRCLAVADQYHYGNSQPRRLTVFRPETGNRNEAQRFADVPLPSQRVVGQSVRPAAGGGRTEMLLTDAAARRIWRCGVWLGNLRPDGKWQPVAIEASKLAAPTDVVALTDGRLIVADGPRVVLLAPAGEAYRAAWQWDGTDSPAGKLGKRIRLAVDGAWMLIADTDRHRVVWLDWPRRKVLGVFGHTDRAGEKLNELNRPTLVSLRGSQAVIADSGNQRVVRLVLAP